MCGGASHQQTEIEASQAKFYDELTKEYETSFGQHEAIFGELKSMYEPILAKGPNQQGFDDATRATLNTQANEGVANNYAHASQALHENLAARGGGNEFLPSGADAQLNEELASSAAGQLSSEQQNITTQDYASGRNLFDRATAVLSGEEAGLNTVGMANAATGAGSAASTTANEITQANNSWMGPVFGALGGIAGAAVGDGGAVTKAIPGCWIAEAIYGADAFETHLLRQWLNTEFRKTLAGDMIMRAYLRFGERIAAAVRQHPLLRRVFKPIFDLALNRAVEASWTL